MFCSACATSIPDGHTFCSKCGKPITQQSSGWKWLSIPIGAFFLLALVVIVAVVIISASRSSSPPSDGTASYIAHVPVVVHRTDPIMPGSFVIEPLHYQVVEFNVNRQMQNIRLQGHFQAQGGSGNDIQVMLLDDDAFLNWKNNHSGAAIYNSGRVTADTMDVTIPPETRKYHLIFDNTFSVLSNKAISADLKLDYDRHL